MQLTSPHSGEDFCALRFGERDRNMHDDVKAELNGLDQDSDHLERDSSTFKAELATLKEERDDSKAARDLSESEYIDWINLCADLCPIAARADDLKQEIDGLKQENTLLNNHIAVLKSQYDELMDLLRMTVQLMAENEAREAGRSSLVQHDPSAHLPLRWRLRVMTAVARWTSLRHRTRASLQRTFKLGSEAH